MRLAWATDIHLDSVDADTIERFYRSIEESGASGLLLSGDIAEATSIASWLETIRSRIALPIYFVLGNHDFYGSDIASVRRRICSFQTSGLTYLSAAAPIRLSPEVSLVGHDGWGDCRIGDTENFVMLTDYFAIRDLGETLDIDAVQRGVIERTALREKLQQLGDQAAAELEEALREAAHSSRTVVVMTHVPPFRTACWHGGSIAAPAWLPGFTCKALGDLLIEVAEKMSECQFTVLCGHTHGFGESDILPNLRVHTGFGEYGELHLGWLDIEASRVSIQIPQPRAEGTGS